MPVFEYTALDIKGKNISGIIDTESATAARQKLRSSQIFPTSIKEVDATPSKKGISDLNFLRSFSRVKARRRKAWEDRSLMSIRS